MSNLLFPLATASVPVAGLDQRFPVHRIYCVGRNYADHAREMGADPTREAPFFFTKPYDALVSDGKNTPYPVQTDDFQHEVELVVALKSGGSDLSLAEAHEAIYGFAVGIDLTRRDLQTEAKKQGRPWCSAKAFDASAPIGSIAPTEHWKDLKHGEIKLEVNQQTRQLGQLAQMIWSVDEVISKLSTLFTLTAGDLIFTGTPAGVAPLTRGDVVTATITGLPPLQTKIV